ncbi:hypothetical protein ACFL1B_06090, partial [Nanoarchaeota archaeon]
MNKRGGVGQVLEFTPNLILTIVAFGILMSMIMMYSNVNIDVKDLQRDIIASRLFLSPSSFSMKDNTTNRTFPGIVDPVRLTTANLQSAIDYPSA